MSHTDNDNTTNDACKYGDVENAINSILNQKQRPTVPKIKNVLGVSDNALDQIIEYYWYMWEQRHATTYLANIEPLTSTELKGKDFAKRTMQLEESLAMMRATIEAAQDCLLMINREGKFVGFNKKFVDLFKIPETILASRDEAEGLNYVFDQLADPQELANLITKKYQHPIQGDCGEMLFKDGRIVERYYQPQMINDEVVGHVWSLRDVTEKRKQEESLHLANRAIVASTHGIILIANTKDLNITYLNPASINLFALHKQDVVQQPFVTAIYGLTQYQEKFLEIFKSHKQGMLTLKCPIGNKMLWLEIHISPVYEKGQQHISHFVSIINDITQKKEFENILQYRAVHDALTGLPNKAYLEDAIRYRIKNKSAQTNCFGLLFIDIDRFKNINDTLGHGVGDELLRLFSKRLESCVQKQDVVARIGGDEFIVLINNITNENTLRSISTRLLEASRKKFTHLDQEFNISASIGVAQFPTCGNDAETLIRNADIAMYHAKFSGRNRTCFYTNELNRTISRRVTIENAFHDAVKNHEFEVHYQPIYSIIEKRFTKAESLIRWKHKTLGAISPTEFIPIAEDIGFITTLGRWIIESVIAQQREWKESEMGDLTLSINVSAKQLLDENFVAHINDLIHRNKVTSQKIILEITESFFLLNEKVSEKLIGLENLGLKIAIDDFGTGYSNLNYLNKLHISYLKIDKSFIAQIDQHHFNDSVLLAIIAIAKKMNFQIIAEGVETENQLSFLIENGCDELQGYYFSKPLAVAEFEKLDMTQKSLELLSRKK